LGDFTGATPICPHIICICQGGGKQGNDNDGNLTPSHIPHRNQRRRQRQQQCSRCKNGLTQQSTNKWGQMDGEMALTIGNDNQ